MEPEPEKLTRLLSDREWRLNNLYMIVDEETGVGPYVARPEQLEFRRSATHLDFIPKARKLGMSTEVALQNLDACVFNPNFRAAIIDKTREDAWKKLEIARFAWKNGPKHPDPNIAAIWREAIHPANPIVRDNSGELAWDNGSSFEADVSFTGGTIQSLHISELGPIAAKLPKKAEEIRRGSMNAVPPSGRITVETTMEGGRIGVCYEIFKQAKEDACKESPTPLDWRLHFFSWLGHPSYVLPGCRPGKVETRLYFEKLTAKYGDWIQDNFGFREVPPERQAWWEGKKATLKDEMCQQFPTVIDECDMAVTVGAIFPEMLSVRASGRVREFPVERNCPLWACWDLGTEDAVAGWLLQETGRDISVVDWSAGDGVGAAGVAQVLTRWSQEHGIISLILIPHDAEIREKGSGLTYRQQLIVAGVPASAIVVVPRTPNVWVGIDEARNLLPRMWFHTRCDQEIKKGELTLPGGVGRLEAYRKTPSSSAAGGVRGVPFKDGVCDHSADALRTYAEARLQNLLKVKFGQPNGAGNPPPKAVTGFRR